MLNTLDSITHAVAVLEERFKGSTVKPFPLYVEDLSKLITKEDNKFYFGVLAIGNGISTNVYTVDLTANIEIKITTNSQIIALFESVKGVDSGSADIDMTNEGVFRGFEIWVNR